MDVSPPTLRATLGESFVGAYLEIKNISRQPLWLHLDTGICIGVLLLKPLPLPPGDSCEQHMLVKMKPREGIPIVPVSSAHVITFMYKLLCYTVDPSISVDILPGQVVDIGHELILPVGFPTAFDMEFAILREIDD